MDVMENWWMKSKTSFERGKYWLGGGRWIEISDIEPSCCISHLKPRQLSISMETNKKCHSVCVLVRQEISDMANSSFDNSLAFWTSPYILVKFVIVLSCWKLVLINSVKNKAAPLVLLKLTEFCAFAPPARRPRLERCRRTRWRHKQ